MLDWRKKGRFMGHATKYFAVTIGALAACLVLSACGDGDRYLQVEGYVEGDFILTAPKVQGRLDAVFVEEGQWVEKGEPLFQLDQTEQAAMNAKSKALVAEAEASLENLLSGKRPQEIEVIQAQLEEKEADLALAVLELKRQQRLVRTGAGSKRALDEAVSRQAFSEASVRELKAQLETAKMPARDKEIVAAQATVEAAKAERTRTQYVLDQRIVYAPAAGTVEDVLHFAGEVVAPASPVVSLLPPENKKLRFFVPQRALSRLEHNNELSVTCDGCPADLVGRVSFIAADAEYTPPVIFSSGSRDKLVFMVEAIPATGAASLKPGQPVEVRVDLDQTPADIDTNAEEEPETQNDTTPEGEQPVVEPKDEEVEGPDQSVERAPVPQESDPTGEEKENQDGPELGDDLDDTVPLEDDAPDHAQEMGEG